MPCIFITGASSGFGLSIAKRFAAGGYDLILTGRRRDRLDRIQSELSQTHGVTVTTLCFDVRDKQAVRTSIESLGERGIDILVNNAGLASGLSTLDQGDTDDWDLMIDTNLKGLLYVTHALLPRLTAQKQGHIINIGSTAGKNVYKNGNVYCATKFAVDALSQAMRIELLPFGVKVTAINPGAAETEFSLVRFKGDEARARAVYEGFQPLRPEDIADVAWYCAQLPPHVCINDLTMTCITQANSVYNLGPRP
ncbi:MAG: SDR family NAD(P)-dependent oxidoreductase [Bacteroidetes bacterium]|nr:SDR family NAD(P)-dependent oxidoreductase [Bacteroidota bacterium]MBS1630306.1 SDR family NAD(P)-dependent oxidoreductase [Bacteroidota bacterium]